MESGVFEFTCFSLTFIKGLCFPSLSSATYQVDNSEKLHLWCCWEFYPKCATSQCWSETLLKMVCERMPEGCICCLGCWNFKAFNPVLGWDIAVGLSSGTCLLVCVIEGENFRQPGACVDVIAWTRSGVPCHLFMLRDAHGATTISLCRQGQTPPSFCQEWLYSPWATG